MNFIVAKTYDEVLTAFLKLENAFFGFDGCVEDFAEKIYKNGVCVICESEDISGLVAFYANDFNTRAAFITSLLVDGKMRGRGIATMLVKKVEKLCVEKGFKQVRLEVNKANIPAISLYTKLGYKTDSVKEKSIYMCKNIEVN